MPLRYFLRRNWTRRIPQAMCAILFVINIERLYEFFFYLIGPQGPPVNACILAMIQEKDIEQFGHNMRMLELNFNSKYNYPYVILNQVPLSNEFKLAIRSFTSANVEFGVIPAHHWTVPDWVDLRRLNESLVDIGFRLEYRHMCRYMSGFFFDHPLTLKYDYYMRIDRDSEFPCPFTYDPLQRLVDERLSYGFVKTSFEMNWTMPTLWQSVRDWHQKSLYSRPKNNSLNFLSDNNGESLSWMMCIMYNNFELAAFSIFRNETYRSFFEHLDKAGGFYHERWGDAPIHTYYVATMLERAEMSFFTDIRYLHQKQALYPRLQKTCTSRLKMVERCDLRWFGEKELVPAGRKHKWRKNRQKNATYFRETLFNSSSMLTSSSPSSFSFHSSTK